MLVRLQLERRKRRSNLTGGLNLPCACRKKKTENPVQVKYSYFEGTPSEMPTSIAGAHAIREQILFQQSEQDTSNTPFVGFKTADE